MTTDVLPDAPFAPRAGVLRSLIRAAFVDPAEQPPARYRYRGAWNDTPPIAAFAPRRRRLIVAVPTLIRPAATASLASALRALAETMRALEAAPAGAACALTVMAQDWPGAAARDAALESMESLWRDAAAEIPFIGVSLPVASKVLALNAALPIADANAAEALAWFDDDVLADRDCLLALWRAFEPGAGRVYGARKIAVPDASRFSAFWARSKNGREPVNRYPHGCAMLISRAALGSGIPPQYITDDHYFLVRFLDPRAPEPLHRLRVVPDAIVRVPSVNSPLAMIRRIHRNYRNFHRVLADLPAPTVRLVLRDLMFPGLHAPTSPPRFIGNAAKLSFWTLVTAEVLARGLLRLPSRSSWTSSAPPRTMVDRQGP